MNLLNANERQIVTDIRKETARQNEPTVQSYSVGIEGLEALFTKTIREELGRDEEALKAFQIEVFKPKNKAQAAALKEFGTSLLTVSGALGISDTGHEWRYFSFEIEQNMSDREDQEVAKALAQQCKMCVANLHKEKRLTGEIAIA